MCYPENDAQECTQTKTEPKRQGRHRNYDIKPRLHAISFFVLLQLSDKAVVLVILDIC